ncbi:hypothetical protein CK203_067368 [Vitis vinifera]|uniref:Uncharacterized protein n=1 Tax=Vitis vinifera TaxID=29760 RepID=A0A438EFZ9_VITVI|nr:hypothetical protein CK203_067368 [Vitis vinifera]
MELKSWIFCHYGSPIAINHPKISSNIDKSTFKYTHCNKTDPTSLDIPQFQATTLGMTRKTMKNRGFEPWIFRSCLGYHHFVINDNNRDQRKKDFKKTSTVTVAKIKTETNVAEKTSTLVAATDYGANGNTTPVIGEGSLTLIDTLNLDSVLVVPSLDYNLLTSKQDKRLVVVLSGENSITWMQSKDSNKLQQALMADGSEGRRKSLKFGCGIDV